MKLLIERVKDFVIVQLIVVLLKLSYFHNVSWWIVFIPSILTAVIFPIALYLTRTESESDGQE